LKQNQRVFHA